MAGLPVGRSLLQFLFGFQDPPGSGLAAAGDASGTSREGAYCFSRIRTGLLPPLPEFAGVSVEVFDDFLDRIRLQGGHASTALLLSHIRRFNALDVGSMDEGGPYSAPAVFRRLVNFHASELGRAPAWQTDGSAVSARDAVAHLPECLEKFVALRAYTVAFGASPAVLQRDEALQRRCAALRSFVEPVHLDLPAEIDAPESAAQWQLACFHLSEMNRYHAPADKCACLTSACHILSGMMSALKARRSAAASVAAAAPNPEDVRSVSPRVPVAGAIESRQNADDARPTSLVDDVSAAASGADDLLPALVLALLRCNPPKVVSNVEYIRDYRAPEGLRSEANYYLTHVEGAVAFLESLSAAQLTGVSAAEFDAALASADGLGGAVQALADVEAPGRAARTSPASPSQSLLGVSAAAFDGPGQRSSPDSQPLSLDAEVVDRAARLGREPCPPRPRAPAGCEDSAVGAVIRSAAAALAAVSEARATTSHAENTPIDAALPGGSAPSRVLVLSPAEIIGVLEPPPPPAAEGGGGDAAAVLGGWLSLRLRFMPLRSAADLRLADLQPLLDEYRALAQTAQNLRYLLAERDLLPLVEPLLLGRLGVEGALPP